MSIDPEAEYARIRTTYARARRRDVLVLVLLFAGFAVASLVHRLDWSFALGTLAAFVAWELTKLKVRRNARDFARSAG
ncbi:MAG: hypothetical protein HOQ22_08355 [Nocardioidaceae bacterium]|nr:hypothetical protein [Nocardioidaceae bacterium]NUS51031.1 hypothetical protein [Nocardioidaceae bacterium]